MSMVKAVVLLAAAVVLGGCAESKQARDVRPSGFLGDYSILRKGDEAKGEALLVYRNPKANWASYRKIMLDPVTLWRGPASQLETVPQADLQRLTDHFYSILYLKLKEDYEMVEKPGPGTLRIQVAITKAEEAWVTPVVVSSVIPQLRLVTGVAGYATGKPAFTGEASIEAKLMDAETGELLAAAVDRRVGTHTLTASSFQSWGDVEKVLQYWANLGSYRLCQGRRGANCVLPKE